MAQRMVGVLKKYKKFSFGFVFIVNESIYVPTHAIKHNKLTWLIIQKYIIYNNSLIVEKYKITYIKIHGPSSR